MRRERGFTLIELMIAVAVLGVVVAVAIPAYTNYVKTGQQEALLNQARSLQMFEDGYRIDNGTYTAGTYTAESNIFAATNVALPPLQFKISGDRSGVTMVVAAGSCGSITNCYKVTATDQYGNQLVLEQNGATTFTP